MLETRSTNLSVVLPNYNHAEYISYALDSLVNQTSLPFELIIIDDASTDNSIDIIQEYVDKYKFISLKKNDYNRGVVDTINESLQSIKTKYVTFVSADDFLENEFIEKTLNLLELHPSAGICSARSFQIDNQGNKKIFKSPCIDNSPTFLEPNQAKKTYYKYGSWFMGNTTVYNTKYLVNAGSFPLELGSYADNFQSMMLSFRYGACYLPDYLSNWRLHANNYSAITSRDASALSKIMNVADRMLKENNIIDEDKIIHERWKKRMSYAYFSSVEINEKNIELLNLNTIGYKLIKKISPLFKLSIFNIKIIKNLILFITFRYYDVSLMFFLKKYSVG